MSRLLCGKLEALATAEVEKSDGGTLKRGFVETVSNRLVHNMCNITNVVYI